MKKILVFLNFWRLIIPGIIYIRDKEIRFIVCEDLKRISYMLPANSGIFMQCMYALIWNKAYRAVFYFRIANYKVCNTIQEFLLPNKREVEISGKIDGGIAIFHGQGTIVHCTASGKNLSVWQNVTVGRNYSKRAKDGRDTPIIGNNVNIYTGSIVAGGITIGDNVDIGAGSVVLKDIPDNCVVAGNPAKIIREKDKI